MNEVSHMSSVRIAVLVSGMHRSGTSALSGMLVKLGAQEPKSLMVPTADNPRGYWESTARMRFHDEVLTSGRTSWSDWDQFNTEWMESAVAGDFIARMPAVLEQEYGASEGRDPGARFSTQGYLARYPDVAAAGLNPFPHYIRYGIWEGRTTRVTKKETVGR